MNRYFNKKSIYSVTTMTPHRVSFAGGGTDYPKLYKKFGGSVISSTINKYLFVTVKAHGEIFKEKYRLMYSKTELCDDISQIKILDDFSDYLNKQLDKTDINALQKLNELLDNYQERYLKIGAIVDGLRNKLGKDVKDNARYQKLVAEMRENTRLSDKVEDRKADLLQALGENILMLFSDQTYLLI